LYAKAVLSELSELNELNKEERGSGWLRVMGLEFVENLGKAGVGVGVGVVEVEWY
jgi:hypothetical protein